MLYVGQVTPKQIGEQFGASQADVNAAVSFLKSKGFAISLVADNRMAILADGTVKQTEAAFGTRIRNYAGPSPDGKETWQFRSNNSPLLLPGGLADRVIDVSGVESYTRPMRRSTTLNPTQTRTLYGTSNFYVNPSFAGQGRTIGISN